MKRPVLIGVIAAVIVVGATAIYLATRQDTATNSGSMTSSLGGDGRTSAQSPEATNTQATTSDVTIVFTNDGFEKSSYTVKAGSTVTVKNNSDMNMQFSSDDHPTHREDPEINMAVLTPGESGTFTPITKGAHTFHDHMNDHYIGTLEVE